MAVVLGGRSFAVLLTDHAMPGMDGAALVRDALRNRPRLVAIITTGYANFSAIREQSPAVTVLKKPFEPQQLVEAIESAISAHRLPTGEH